MLFPRSPWDAQHGVPSVGTFSILSSCHCGTNTWAAFSEVLGWFLLWKPFPDGNGDGDKGPEGVRLSGHQEEQPQSVLQRFVHSQARTEPGMSQ